MSRFFSSLSKMRPLSWYLITRGLQLACAMLISALVMLIWAQGGPPQAWLLRWYADYICTMSGVVAATGLLGGALVEEVLRRCSP